MDEDELSLAQKIEIALEMARDFGDPWEVERYKLLSQQSRKNTLEKQALGMWFYQDGVVTDYCKIPTYGAYVFDFLVNRGWTPPKP